MSGGNCFCYLDGMIMVWHTRTGQCLRCLECAHSQGITVLLSLVMEASCETASVDNTARDPWPKIQQVVKKILWPSTLVMQLMLLLPPVIAQSRFGI
ncbi:hypothetical protein OIU74_000798 [Salix koriyanagi]|uniref:Uncharacterized protein n=1 Tax=Salix koriyanagi TaxID=2511006 RepID=A0A9Q1AMR8_9ROSI|nr:hypothetical protein OIU74_000798 [Salix koriyanagi]